MKKDETEESLPNDEITSAWSNIDATSIYRSGSDSKNPVDKGQLNQIVIETKSFFKIGTVMLVIVVIIFFILSYL